MNEYLKSLLPHTEIVVYGSRSQAQVIHHPRGNVSVFGFPANWDIYNEAFQNTLFNIFVDSYYGWVDASKKASSALDAMLEGYIWHEISGIRVNCKDARGVIYDPVKNEFYLDKQSSIGLRPLPNAQFDNQVYETVKNMLIQRKLAGYEGYIQHKGILINKNMDIICGRERWTFGEGEVWEKCTGLLYLVYALCKDGADKEMVYKSYVTASI